MDAGRVRKGVRAHDGLVRLHGKARDLRHHLGCRHDLRRVDAHRQVVVGGARAQRHHHFFQRRIAGPLAQAIDRALDLPRAADHDAGQRIGHGQAQVVMAMDRPDGLIGIRYAFAQALDGRAEDLGHGVAHRIGEIDGGGALGDHALQHAAEEILVGAAAVFRAEFDVVRKLARVAHGVLRL